MKRHIKTEDLDSLNFKSGAFSHGKDYRGNEIGLFKPDEQEVYIIPLGIQVAFMFHSVPLWSNSKKFAYRDANQEIRLDLDYWHRVSLDTEQRLYFTASPLIAQRLLSNRLAAVVVMGGWQEHRDWSKYINNEMKDWTWTNREVSLVYQPEEKMLVKSMGVISAFRRCLGHKKSQVSLVEMTEYVN